MRAGQPTWAGRRETAGPGAASRLPVGDPATATSERLDYIAQLTQELASLAGRCPGCEVLAGLLDLAHREARLRQIWSDRAPPTL